VAAGTATLRDAADGEDFIRRVRERTGVQLEIVSGETEAWLSYLAVMHGLRFDPSRRLLIIDIGGGSTEFIRAAPSAKLQMASLQIGSVRLTERIIHHDPPTAREAADLRLAIDAELKGLGWKLETDLLVGIAGTVTTVCAVALQMETYDPDRVHGYRLSRKEVERVLGLFGSRPLAERRKLKGLDPARADVIFAGTAILERVMSEADADSVTVSDQGVRWGLVWRELGAGGAEPPPKPS
jgi:exopolyphosphatase/guanosine-5'-triphosphate,3'-diphosphate pyrophosphatase